MNRRATAPRKYFSHANARKIKATRYRTSYLFAIWPWLSYDDRWEFPLYIALICFMSQVWRVQVIAITDCRCMNVFHVSIFLLRELTMLTLLIAICIFSTVHATSLETVHDDELLNLIKTEKYVVVLFSKFVFFSLVM